MLVLVLANWLCFFDKLILYFASSTWKNDYDHWVSFDPNGGFSPIWNFWVNYVDQMVMMHREFIIKLLISFRILLINPLSSSIPFSELDVISDVSSPPGWSAWRPWGKCNYDCNHSEEEGHQEGFRERYRCWDPKDFQNPGENCGSGSEQPGQGTLCGRYQSQLCYETDRIDCDHSSCDMECIWSDWSEWGTCTPECRDGYRIRNWWFFSYLDQNKWSCNMIHASIHLHGSKTEKFKECNKQNRQVWFKLVHL